jgi:hypothetical protein
MKTAIEEALDSLSKLEIKTPDEMELLGRVASILFLKLEKEKRQISLAYGYGYQDCKNNIKIDNADQYYNNKFKKQNT